ncbi:MAG: hypothetical protein GWP91_24200, partial [Rhodobacterales bacterium]|nr:hypothetical protein [Rhodobacterales bacterium]
MRRTSTVLGSSVLLVLAMGAFADSFTDTGNAQWSAFTNTNINTGNNLDLQIADVIDSTDTWYRFPFDGVTWSLELDKDDDVDYSDRDRCLVAQSISSTDIATINGTDYRAGTTRFNGGGTDYESTVATGSLLAMPAGLATVNEVQFVTAGAKNAGSSYTVRFHYADNSTADVVVPIVVDTDTTITRESTGANYDVFRYTGLTHTSDVAFDVDGDTFSDCGGDGADEVWVTNPNLAKDVDDIEFIYTDFTTATADWLGGPLAVNVLTDPADLSASILFEGDIDSGEDTTIDAATGALWYQLSWNATIPSDGSVLEAYVSCSATGGAGTFSPEVVVDLASGSSHVLASPCEGQYLRYRLEFTAGWDISPTLDDITFDWDPDTDTDGYGSLGLAGTVDCDDTDGAIKPGAVEIVGDEVDQNCDNIEECWLDSDNDVDRSNSATKLSTTDLDCTDFEEALDSDPIDCNDSDNSINSGATELAGDEIDQNCDNLELCYADADADTYRHI